MAWDPTSGFYVSTAILDAPWDEEVQGLHTRVGKHIKKACIDGRNLDEYLTFISFKSHDGDPYTKPSLPGKGEVPEDFKWTSIYYNNPSLKALIDWFPVAKTRVRLARATPKQDLQFHFDWDNARHEFALDEHQVRIWVALDNNDCWYRLSDGRSDVHFQLDRGQFVVLDVDQVLHATENCDERPRNNLIIHCKTNFWIRSLPDLFPKRVVLDPRSSDPQ
jgi:hypothetical protein